jgi:hypothetical protein
MDPLEVCREVRALAKHLEEAGAEPWLINTVFAVHLAHEAIGDNATRDDFLGFAGDAYDAASRGIHVEV